MGTRPQPPVGESTDVDQALRPTSSGGMVGGGADGRSLDELLRYINGEGAGGKQTTPKKGGKANPRKRQQGRA